jgi:selenide, water dikinase
LMDVLYDPQTSGGLLIALSPADAEKLVAALRGQGEKYTAIVGEVVQGPPGRIAIL